MNRILKKFLNNTCKVVVFLSKRCLVLCLLALLILWVNVKHDKVIFKAQNHLLTASSYLTGYAEGRNSFDRVALYHAVRYYRNVVKLLPDSGTGHGALAYCYYCLGDQDKAMRHYQKAAILESDFFGFYYNLGLILFQTGRYPEAIKALEEAVSISPLETVFYGVVISPYKKDVQGDRMKEIKRGYAKCYEMIVLSYERLDDFDEVLAAAKLGINYSPDNKDFFYYYAGMASYKFGEYQKAVFFLRESIKLNPSRFNGKRPGRRSGKCQGVFE